MHNDQSHYFLKQLHSYKVGLVCDFIAHKPAQSDCLLMKSHDPYTGERGGGVPCMRMGVEVKSLVI